MVGCSHWKITTKHKVELSFALPLNKSFHVMMALDKKVMFVTILCTKFHGKSSNIFRIHPLGILNICTKFLSNPSQLLRYCSLWGTDKPNDGHFLPRALEPRNCPLMLPLSAPSILSKHTAS